MAERFTESIEAALESIGQNPLAWSEIEQDIRRKLTRVFPYAVLYSAEPERILVLAIMHCHQQPGYWRHRALAAARNQQSK